MSRRVFLDANVLLYLYDIRDESVRKRQQAIELVRRETMTLGVELVVSTQVFSEFASVSRRRGLMPAERLKERLRGFEANMTVYAVDTDTIVAAIDRADRYKISFIDAQILEAAERAGCDLLLTEDLNDGQVYGKVRVENPFKPH